VRFKLRDPLELERAADYLAKLAGRESTVDIKRVTYKRSLSQNAYYHLMLSYFGTQVGHTLQEVKWLIRELQSDLYKVEHPTIAGVKTYKSRSSADFNSAEMTTSIDRFREWASEQGIDIPAPSEQHMLAYMDDTVSSNEAFL
jgi:hypothetical protein